MSCLRIIAGTAIAGLGLAAVQPLQRFFLDAALYPMAKAIDGTTGAFYYGAGSGGGWCYSLADCYGRSLGSLGSTKNIPTTQTLNGLLSSDCTLSPLCNYNVVYMKYSDGNSFSGMLTDPVMYNNGSVSVPLYFRGRYILDAIIDAVSRNVMGSKNLLKNARHIVETGCSAGGLATYLHADYVESQIPRSGQYFSAPISGYFINHANPEGVTIYGDEIKTIYGISNASTNAACQAFYVPKGEGWKCNMAEYVYPFISANVFVLNSKFDSWQTGCIMTAEKVTIPSHNGNCSASPGYGACARVIGNCTDVQITDTVVPFGDYMTNSIVTTNGKKALSPGNGGFVHSCHTHCEAQGGGFNLFSINGTSMQAAFTSWYNSNIATGGQAPAAANWLFDCDYKVGGNHQCNPTCNAQ